MHNELQDLEPVRQKPAMYLGGRDERACLVCIFEILERCIIDSVSGGGEEVLITICKDGSVCMEADGCAASLIKDAEFGLTELELELTTFWPSRRDSYFWRGSCYQGRTFSLSIAGVGARCVNAVSEWLVVQVSWERKVYEIGFSRGVAVDPLKVIRDADTPGARYSFKLDPEIFHDRIGFCGGTIRTRLREIAALFNPIRFLFRDEREGDASANVYYYKNGIADLVTELAQHNKRFCSSPLCLKGEADGVSVEVAIHFVESLWHTQLRLFTNSHRDEDGTHAEGFVNGLLAAAHAWAVNELKKKFPKRSGTVALLHGVVAVISVTHKNPRYEGATKEKLIYPDVETLVRHTVKEGLIRLFGENARVAHWVQKHCVLNIKPLRRAEDGG